MTTTTTRIRSINVGKLALVYGVICGVLGIIIGLLLGLFVGLFGSALASSGSPFSSFGWLSVVLFPIGYAIGLFVVGFIEGLIIAAVYNLVAGWIGGVELELETVQ